MNPEWNDYWHVCVGRLHIDIIPARTAEEAIAKVYTQWSDFGKKEDFRAFRCAKTG